MKKLLLATVSAVAFSFGAHAQLPAAAQLWFHPTQDWDDAKYPTKDQDYTDLFKDTGLWPNTYATINYFGMNDHFAGNGPAAELSATFAFLNSHKVPLRVTFQMVDAYQTGCGNGIEGMLHQPTDIQAYVNHITQSGGVVAMISTDEPLWFGHYYSGPNACQFSIAQIAQQVAANVKLIRQTFPNAVFVDEEPTDVEKYAKTGDVQKFYNLLAQYGTPVQSVTLDVQWHRTGWDTHSKAFVAALNSVNIKYNVFADSWNAIKDGAQWNQDAIQNLYDWARIITTPPQAFVVASWDQYPDHVVPEFDNSALSWLSAEIAGELNLPTLR